MFTPRYNYVENHSAQIVPESGQIGKSEVSKKQHGNYAPKAKVVSFQRGGLH